MENNTFQLDTKTSYIYKLIKSDILKGQINPGEKLVISKMAKNFGVSTIPVREAFNQLKAEGLLESVPHTGHYVKGIDLDYLKEIYPIRGILEGYATRLAGPALTDTHFKEMEGIVENIEKHILRENFKPISGLNYRFHMSIYRRAGNKALLDMIDNLMKATDRVRAMYDLIPERATASNQEHQKILVFLSNRKIDEAADLINNHIQEILKDLVEFIQRERRILNNR